MKKNKVIIFFFCFWVTDSDSGNFITNTGTLGFSVGSPFSYGVEKSILMEIK